MTELSQPDQQPTHPSEPIEPPPVGSDRCPHLSLSGDEGPVGELGRMPNRWRCDQCGEIITEGESAQAFISPVAAAWLPDLAKKARAAGPGPWYHVVDLCDLGDQASAALIEAATPAKTRRAVPRGRGRSRSRHFPHNDRRMDQSPSGSGQGTG